MHPETGELVGIYFHAHRNHDGCWVAAPDVQRTPEGRPIAYVALHGHGTYPVSGKVLLLRLSGMDRTCYVPIDHAKSRRRWYVPYAWADTWALIKDADPSQQLLSNNILESSILPTIAALLT